MTNLWELFDLSSSDDDYINSNDGLILDNDDDISSSLELTLENDDDEYYIKYVINDCSHKDEIYEYHKRMFHTLLYEDTRCTCINGWCFKHVLDKLRCYDYARLCIVVYKNDVIINDYNIYNMFRILYQLKYRFKISKYNNTLLSRLLDEIHY